MIRVFIILRGILGYNVMDLITKYDLLNSTIERVGSNTLLGAMLMDLTNNVLNKKIDVNDAVFIKELQEIYECYTDYKGEYTDCNCDHCKLNMLCKAKDI